MQFTTNRSRVAGLCAIVIGLLCFQQPAEASFAKRTGQPISAYSASLFGKTNLSSLQLQTLTCDPDEPIEGSTSAQFNPGIVDVIGFGFGPGYEALASSPFPSGFGIEIFSSAHPSGQEVVDLGQFTAVPQGALPTGYLRAYFQLGPGGVGATGKLTENTQFQEMHPGFTLLDNDGPVGVDTHYFDFQYRTLDDSVAAPYSVFAEEANQHYVRDPNNPSQFILLDSDYVVAVDTPNTEDRPGGAIPFQSASVSGTIPEPASLGLLALAGLALRRRRSQ